MVTKGKIGRFGVHVAWAWVSHHIRVRAPLFPFARAAHTLRTRLSVTTARTSGTCKGPASSFRSHAGVKSVPIQTPIVLGLLCSSGNLISSTDTVPLLVALGGLSRCEQLGPLILWSPLTQPLAKLEGFCLSAAGKVQLLLGGIFHCLTSAPTQALQSTPSSRLRAGRAAAVCLLERGESGKIQRLLLLPGGNR